MLIQISSYDHIFEVYISKPCLLYVQTYLVGTYQSGKMTNLHNTNFVCYNVITYVVSLYVILGSLMFLGDFNALL